MKQLIVNPSDTIQVLTGHSEENEVHSFSSHIAECFQSVLILVLREYWNLIGWMVLT